MPLAMDTIVPLKGVYQGLKSRIRKKTVEDFRSNLMSVRTGRASVHMLDNVRVDYYGTETPLSQVAQLATPEANLIVVTPYEPSLVAPIEKAIRTSGHGASTRCTMARSSVCRFLL